MAFGYYSSEADTVLKATIGKTIASVTASDPCVILFDDATTLTISDEGQSCCEHRYMTCDDNLSSFIGAKLVAVVEKSYDSSEGEYDDCHEELFIEVQTSNGDFTLVNHNEHNGYYGGFSLRLRYSGSLAQ